METTRYWIGLSIRGRVKHKVWKAVWNSPPPIESLQLSGHLHVRAFIQHQVELASYKHSGAIVLSMTDSQLSSQLNEAMQTGEWAPFVKLSSVRFERGPDHPGYTGH